MGWLVEHTVHLALVGVPTLGLAAVVLPEVVRARGRRGARSTPTPAVLAAALLAGAGGAHVVAAPGHWAQWPVAALGLTLIGLAQLAGAALLLRRGGPAALQAAAGGCLLVLTLFLVAHTAGLPGAPSGVVAPDHTGTALVAGACELALLALAAVTLRRARRDAPVPHPRLSRDAPAPARARPAA